MGGLFKQPKPPKVPEPARMPDLQDPAALEAKRRQLQNIAMRGGRDSTILSDNLSGSTGKLGG